jgi:hypothetical protein
MADGIPEALLAAVDNVISVDGDPRTGMTIRSIKRRDGQPFDDIHLREANGVLTVDDNPGTAQ